MLKMKKILSALISGVMMLSVIPSAVMANTGITIATTDGNAAEVGNTLRAEVTNPSGDVTYLWMADGEAIEGANSQELVLTYEHFGKTVSCMAIDENDAYPSNELQVISDFDKHVNNTFANFTVATLGTEKTGFGNKDWEFEMVNPYGSTMSFSLLDIQNNKDSKYYIMANDYYAARNNNSNSNAAVVDTVYNPELPGTVAYNANYGYTSKNGAQWSLPDAMADAVDTDHVWITEKAYEGSITQPYTFKAGVVVPAIWEMREYIDRIKIDIRKSHQISTKHTMWLRTALKDNHYHGIYPDPDNDGDYTEDMIFQSGTTGNWQFRLNALHIANSTGYLRAEFFLNEDFFKNGKINLATAGANVLAEISKHSYEDLSKLYTDEEIAAYLSVTIPSDARAQISAVDGGAFEVGNRAIVNVRNLDGILTYKWTADGVQVGTSEELILTYAHFGKNIECTVSNGTVSVKSSNAVEVTSKDFVKYGYEVPASGGLTYNIGNVTGEGDSTWEFKIDGKSFTILKTNNNDESTFFVIANDFYGTKSGTALSVAKWDVNDIDGLPGYINEELYADGIAPIHLPVGIGNSINRNHVWMTEASARATSGATEAYTITAGVVAPSYWEWRTYIDRIKVDIRPGVVTPYWFRTGYLDAYFRTLNSDAMQNGTNLLIGRSSDNTYNYFRGNILAKDNGVGLVRPVFHLKKDFFRTAKIDLATAGSNIINTMKTMYTNEELLNVYTKAELNAAGFDIGFSAVAEWTDGTNVLSGLAGKSTIAANISIASGEATDASANAIVALYDEDNNLVKVAVEPVSIPAKKTANKTVSLTGLSGVTDEYTVKAFVWNSLDGMTTIIDDVLEFQSGVTATSASIDATTRSKVFFSVDPIEMKVTADGSFNYEVEDYYGDVVKKGKINSDGKSDKKINLTGDLGIGYYEIVVYSPESGKPLDRTSVSIVEDYNFETTKDTSIFGVNSHIGKNAHRHIVDLVGDEAKKLGVGNLREGYYWHLMETVKGQCALNDNSLWYSAYKNGIGLYLTGGFRNRLYMPDEDIKYPTTAEAMEAFANYGQVLCDAFPAKYPLKEYEVWNEWWSWDYTPESIERYAEIFDYTYDKLSVTEPNTKLITCFVNRDTPVGYNYNEELLKTNVAQQMDIATIHCYGGTQTSTTDKRPEVISPVTESVATLRNLMTKYGVGDKEIWLTETGYSTFPIDVYGNSVKPEDPYVLSNAFCISEKEAAMYYPRLILLGLAEGCDRVYTYQMCDGYYDITTQESFYGLLRGDDTVCGVYSPKPMYSSYAALIRALDNTEFKNLDINDSCYEYTFANDTKTVTAVYSIDGASTYTYYTDTPVTVIDIMGRSVEMTPENGRITLNIDGNVQYIRKNI